MTTTKDHGNKWAGVAPGNYHANRHPGVHAPGTHDAPDCARYCFDTEYEAAEHMTNVVKQQIKVHQEKIDELQRMLKKELCRSPWKRESPCAHTVRFRYTCTAACATWLVELDTHEFTVKPPHRGGYPNSPLVRIMLQRNGEFVDGVAFRDPDAVSVPRGLAIVETYIDKEVDALINS